MTHNELKKVLSDACKKAGGQKAWATSNNLSAAYVNDILLDRREIGQSVLDALRYRKIVTYQAMQKRKEKKHAKQ